MYYAPLIINTLYCGWGMCEVWTTNGTHLGICKGMYVSLHYKENECDSTIDTIA